MSRLSPSERCPALELPCVGGGQFSLAQQNPGAFTLLVFYRGFHCPACKTQLRELDTRLSDLTERGVQAVAVSMDPLDRAQSVRSEWEVGDLPVAYGLTEHDARDWGLFISSATSQSEPERFAEPGLFLIRPDTTLYAAWIQSTPFARPRLDDVVSGVDFVTAKDYPARGVETAKTQPVAASAAPN